VFTAAPSVRGRREWEADPAARTAHLEVPLVNSPRRRVLTVAAAASAALALTACGTNNNSTGSPAATTPPAPVATTAAEAPTSAPDTSAATTGAATTGAAGGAPVACAAGSLAGAGSTFQKNFESQAIKDFGSVCSGTKVDYQPTGSGAGIQSFGTGQVDFAGSDSLMKADEQATANRRCGGSPAIHIPLTAGAVVLTYNLKGFTGDLKLSPASVAGIAQNKITTWDDPAIKADNAGAKLPSTDITFAYRNDSSGTTDILSRYLTAAAGKVWTLGTGKDIQFPGGQGQKGSDGVVNAVKSTDGGITYTELSYAVSNQLKTVQVKNASGAFVAPSGAASAAALKTAKVDASMGDLRISPDYVSSDPAAYPVAAPTYVIVCSKGNKRAAALKSYVSFATGTEQSKADSVGYAPLPDVIATKVAPLVASIA